MASSTSCSLARPILPLKRSTDSVRTWLIFSLDFSGSFAASNSSVRGNAAQPFVASARPCVKKSGEAELLANLVGCERRFAFVADAGFNQIKVVVQIFHLLAQRTDLFKHGFLLPFQNGFLWSA